jgi:Icc-related predicted phosphoesterase
MPLNETKKKVIRNWTFKVGYDKALEVLRKEHEEVFINLGNKDGTYSEERINRLDELVEGIHYVEMLKKIGAHNIGIFK